MKTTNSEIQHIGKIVLGSRTMLSDPCYNEGTLFQGVINTLPGEYDCLIEIGQMDIWGERVKKLIVRHTSADLKDPDDPLPYYIGVDSGTAGVFDLEYYRRFHSKTSVDDVWYESEVCDWANEQLAVICEDKAVISSSGYGDGGYDCYVSRDRNGYINAISIVFIPDDDLNNE